MPWPDALQLTQLLASAGLELSPDADPDGALASAVSEVEFRLNRKYATTAEARRFDGNGGEHLWIPPCSSITKVELLDAEGTPLYELGADDYLAYPLNAAVKTGLKPARVAYWAQGAYGSLSPRGLTVETSRHAAWPLGHGNVRVTATWGEASVPAEVARAALLLAAVELVDAGRLQMTGGVVSRKEGDTEETYGQNTMEGLKKTWGDKAERILTGGRRRIMF